MTPCPDGENGHRRCRAMVGPTSHGVREEREGAARHRIAISTSGEHCAAAAEGAWGENRLFGLSPAYKWLPMPTSTECLDPRPRACLRQCTRILHVAACN